MTDRNKKNALEVQQDDQGINKSETQPSSKETEMSNNIILASHRNDEVLYERRIPAAELGPDFRISKQIPQGRVLYDVYDGDGNELEAEWPEDAPEVEFPNDSFMDTDGLLYVYRGSYWVDAILEEDGQQVAVLHLGKKIRCTVHDWCVGHFMGQGDKHSGEVEILHVFDHQPASLQKQDVQVWREQNDDGVENAYVAFNIETVLDHDGVRHLAEELLEVAEKLVGRGLHMKAN